MVSIQDYGDFETAWCPGCGNFGIMQALKKALVQAGLEPQQVFLATGIGQAAKAPHYINANIFNGLHGRSLPLATAVKLTNRELTVIALSGDGCHYAEGGNHFFHAIRRNLDITVLVHDNQVYGLTKGQASPTSDMGFTNKAQPLGAPSAPFNPLAVAITMDAPFVARGFSGNIDHLADLMVQAINHRGLALIDILQPCVSFNRVNTFAWYKERCYELPDSHDPADREAALKKSFEWGKQIPLGLIYRTERPVFEDRFPVLAKQPLVDQKPDKQALQDILDSFI